MWKLVSVGIFAFVLSLLITPSGSLGTIGVRAAVTPTLSTTASPGGPVNTTSLNDTATVTGTAGGFTCPPQDTAGFAIGQKDESASPIFCSYPAFPGEDPNDFFCTYNHSTGALVTDNDAGFCPATAVGSAGATPTGTVIFNVYGPNDTNCTGASVFTSTKTLSGGSATSDFLTPAAPGVYRWTASYGGDANYLAVPAACNGANESATITPALATPTLSTTASAGGPIGTVVNDTATLSGGTSPTGTITFTLKNPSNSTVYTDVVTVSGNGSYSTAAGNNPGGYTTTVAGTYVWTATYSGDAGNNSATDNGQNESVVIAAVLPTPTLSTTASAGGPAGTALHDTATVAGGTAFTCPPQDLAGRPVESSLVSTDLFCRYQTVPNDFFCKYFVDTGLLKQDHDNGFCPPVGVPSGPPSTPTGTVIFNLYGPNDATCAGVAVFTSTQTLSGGTAGSGNFTPGAAGVYRWTASYGGDSNYSAVPAACNGANESATITAAVLQTPTLSTTASAGGPVGTALHDTGTVAGPGGGFTCPAQDTAGFAIGQKDESASPIFCSYPAFPGEDPNDFFCTYSHSSGTLVQDHDAGFCPATAVGSGGSTPTGTVIFNLYGPNDATCAGVAVFTSTQTLSGGTAGSGNFTPGAAGIYRWTASYGGDSNYSAVPAACNGANESATITAVLATPTISTVAGGTVVLGSGSKLTDTASLSGASSPTGTITFTLKNPSNSVVYTDVVTVSGNGSYTTAQGNNPGGYLPTVVGTYLWSAAYSGDAGNNSATDNGQNENETVSPASVAVSTQASAGGPIGTVVNDTATLSGGTSPTGTITFTLKNPSNGTVYTDVVTVSGNGSYSTAAGNNPGGYTTTVAGTYVWTATYSGDAGNNSATDNGQNESVEIGKASPTISTQASQGGPIGAAGSPIWDTATVSGGTSPTGTVTFRLYGDAGCTTQVFTSTNPLAGGTATSGNYIPTTNGTYYWTATYNGDANNNAVTSPCGAPGESVTIGDPCAAILRLLGWSYGTPVGCPPSNRPPQRGGH